MKLGIMQPYFFPYIGYFQLIHASDRFILFDTPQYEKRGWMNRNRIINLKEGSTYITATVNKTPQKTPINKIILSKNTNWENKLLAQLEIYKKIAPHYSDVIFLLKDIFSQNVELLSEFNRLSLQKTCDFLNMNKKLEVFTELNIDISDKCEPDEWALRICQALGYSEYVNAPGGAEFFDKKKYEVAKIDLKFLKPQLKPYLQKIGRWEAGLSIIDVMMFNSVEEIQDMLKQYELK